MTISCDTATCAQSLQAQAAELGHVGGVQGGGNPPPSSNTGVDCTSGLDLGQEVICDWVSGTFKKHDTVTNLEIVRDFFGDIVPLDFGGKGYAHSGLILGGKGRAYWNSDHDRMGVHVEAPSGAIANLPTCQSYGSFADFWGSLIALGFEATRFDAARDDHEGLLEVKKIAACMDSGHCVTRFRENTEIRKLGKPDGERGHTVYLGSPKSDARIRIYDKAAERGTEGHWVRVELQTRGKLAHEVLKKLIIEGPGFIPGLILKYIDFKEPTGDSNTRRWPVAAWWHQFLGFAEKVRLVLPEVERTIESVKEWVRHQVAPSLGLIVEAEQGCTDWFYWLLKHGRARLNDSHRALLRGAT